MFSFIHAHFFILFVERELGTASKTAEWLHEHSYYSEKFGCNIYRLWWVDNLFHNELQQKIDFLLLFYRMQALPKPQLRGLLKSQLQRQFVYGLIFTLSITGAWKFGVMEPKKKKYAEFYK